MEQRIVAVLPDFRNEPAKKYIKDSVICQHEYMNYTLGTLLNPTNLELLKEIKERAKLLEMMADFSFSAVFNAFQQIEENSQRNAEEQVKLRENVQKRFRDHEEFIRTHLPI